MALYLRVFEDYPIIIAANRDEHYDRPSAPPSVFGVKPTILAGRDLRAGGTWLGINECGLVVGILNRRSKMEQVVPEHPRSRGLLCLELLGLESAAEAKAYLQEDRESEYQPFTLVLADRAEAWMAFNAERKIAMTKLSEELHVFSNVALHDERSEKRDRAYDLFADLVPDLKSNAQNASVCISRLSEVLSDHKLGNDSSDPRDAICVHGDISGTVSSSIIFYSQTARRVDTFYSPGPPCQFPFAAPITLDLR